MQPHVDLQKPFHQPFMARHSDQSQAGPFLCASHPIATSAPPAARRGFLSYVREWGKRTDAAEPDRQGVALMALINRAKTQEEPAGELQTISRVGVAGEFRFGRGRLSRTPSSK